MTTVPALAGAVAVRVNDAAPVEAPAAIPELNVTEQLSKAPALFKLEQDTADTPVPGVTAVALTPAGN